MVAFFYEFGQSSDQSDSQYSSNSCRDNTQGGLEKQAREASANHVFMNGGHLLEFVFEKKVEPGTDKIVHQSSSGKGVTMPTGLLAKWVEKVVDYEFFGHFERFGVAVLDSLSDTEHKSETEGSTDSESNLLTEIIAWEHLGFLRVSLLSHRFIDLI